MISPHSGDNKGNYVSSHVSPDVRMATDSLTAGGLPSITENQSKFLENEPASMIESNVDMGMGEDSIIKEEFRLSAVEAKEDPKEQMKMDAPNDSILSKEESIQNKWNKDNYVYNS